MLLIGIPKVSLKDNRLFTVTNNEGEAPRVSNAELGFYFNDTRYLSNWEMTLNDQKLVYLSHELRGQGNSCVFSMTNRDLPSVDGSYRIQRDTFLIRRVITLYRDTVFEQLEFANYDVVEHELKVQHSAESRFDDIFEVRGYKRVKRGQVFGPKRNKGAAGVMLEYEGVDRIRRKTIITALAQPKVIEAEDQAAFLTYRLKVPGKGSGDIKTIISFDNHPTGDLCGEPFRDLTMNEHLQAVERLGRKTYLGDLKLRSDNPIFDRAMMMARLDIEMLTTLEPSGLVYPYAGIPWFSAPFGRDGLITAYQALPWYPKLARGVLDYAFSIIGKKQDLFTDEEPGKIFHEMRRGEMAKLREVPYIPYYGSVDSTPLALILAGEYYAWTHDDQSLKEWWPEILKALAWIDQWGDSDGDLFLEYIKKSPTGLDNQGWKDSHNSIMHSNGQLAAPPIKLCEVQAYAYRARHAIAEVAICRGENDFAMMLMKKAEALKARFYRKFWDKKDHYVYMALDGNSQPCAVMSSNQGHCLWGKILPHKEAVRVGHHLMSPRLFSGYGVRTLASDEKSYNPLSYHNGSVWPHDNSLIAEGFRFYQLMSPLQKLANALFDVVALSEDFRLPELFCGFRRRNDDAPIPYEVACRPQAWAAGSVFLLLKSILGFTMSCTQENIVFQTPFLPSKVLSLQIEGLKIRNTEFNATVQQGRDTGHIEIERRHGPLQILVSK